MKRCHVKSIEFWGIYFSMLVLFIFYTLSSMIVKSPTYDEVSHLGAGYSYIRTGNFKLNFEHPPLVKIIAALPLLFLNLTLPIHHTSWQVGDAPSFGEQFLYYNNYPPDLIIFISRIPIILISLVLGFYVFRWTNQLYGIKAGLFALFLYVFSPNILAHSRLVTYDIPVSCFMLISVYYFWRFINTPTRKNIIIVGIVFGLAQLTKFVSIHLVFIYILLGLIVLILGNGYLIDRSLSLYQRIFLLVRYLLIIFLIGMFIINAGYLFKGIFLKLSNYEFINPMLSKLKSKFASVPVPLPYLYIKGIDWQLFHSKGHWSGYLMGEHSTTGWWYYFILAFLMKTPISMIIFIILSICLSRNLVKFRSMLDEYFLIIPIFWILIYFSFFNKINIGLRYILPIYPFLFIYVSKIVNMKFLTRLENKIYMFILILLCGWYFYSSISIYPHYLAYFNELVGGPDNGYKYLIDSNIDWGQDMKGLKNYLYINNITEVKLSPYRKVAGEVTPECYRIFYKPLRCGIPSTGLIAVSVNDLVGLTEERSKCFSWLRKYKPIKKIGYSIFIYNITNIGMVPNYGDTSEKRAYSPRSAIRASEVLP